MRTASNVHFAPGDMAAAAIIALLLVAASWTAAIGGPVTDFEKALAAAYAPYRAALMHTNQKDKAATELSLKSFDAKWSELMKTYKSAPPPQYADDPKWPATIGAIERILATARGEVAKGDLGKAHDVLEGIREELGHLRVRNGVITFSDRMDLYHEKMEQVLTGKYSDLNANGIGMLREDSAVLAHLAQQIHLHAPAALGQDPVFKDALSALQASIGALQEAARSADKSAVQKALQGLKPPYARMFVKFG